MERAPNLELAPSTTIPCRGQEVAIVGMAVRVPGASTPEALWQMLLSGESLLEHGWEAHAGNRGRSDSVNGEHQANHQEQPSDSTGLASTIAEALSALHLDPADRVCLIIAGHDAEAVLEQRYAALGLAHRVNVAVDRIAADSDNKEALRTLVCRLEDNDAEIEPCRRLRAALYRVLPESAAIFAIDAACASALYAVDVGVKHLIAGQFDVAICASASTYTRLQQVMLHKLAALSRGEMRPLDERSDGM